MTKSPSTVERIINQVGAAVLAPSQAEWNAFVLTVEEWRKLRSIGDDRFRQMERLNALLLDSIDDQEPDYFDYQIADRRKQEWCEMDLLPRGAERLLRELATSDPCEYRRNNPPCNCFFCARLNGEGHSEDCLYRRANELLSDAAVREDK